MSRLEPGIIRRLSRNLTAASTPQHKLAALQILATDVLTIIDVAQLKSSGLVPAIFSVASPSTDHLDVSEEYGLYPMVAANSLK